MPPPPPPPPPARRCRKELKRPRPQGLVEPKRYDWGRPKVRVASAWVHTAASVSSAATLIHKAAPAPHPPAQHLHCRACSLYHTEEGFVFQSNIKDRV